MKRTFTRIFLIVGFFLSFVQCAHAYGIDAQQDVGLTIGAGGSPAVLVAATLPVTSSAASANDVGMDSKSTGTGNGGSLINTAAVLNATGGTTNSAATFSGGKVGIGTHNPAAGVKVDTGRLVKKPSTGNKACKASDVGAMRYNVTGNYMEICSYP